MKTRFLISFILPGLAAAQQPLPPRTHSPRPTSAGITPADARTREYIIADDSMTGRAPATAGESRATSYVAGEAKRLGLEPAGEQGTYFQSVPVVTVRFDRASRVVAGDVPLQFRDDVVPAIPDGRWRLRAFDGAQAMFGGILTDSATYPSPSLTAGKAIVFEVDTNAKGTRLTLPVYALREPGGRFANAAALILVGPRRGGTGINTPALAEKSLSTMTLAAPDIDVPLPPTIFMSRRAAQLLFDAPLSSLRPGATGRELHGSLAYSLVVSGAGRSVVAVLRGRDSTLAGEYVAISAHLDHLGTYEPALDHDSVLVANRMFRPLGARQPAATLAAADVARLRAAIDSVRRLRPMRMDSIYNGADDDGSGSTAVLEIAEAFATARVRPRRSLLFIWHTAEEAGLIGSRLFTEHPTVPRDSIIADLQMDHVSRGRAEDTPGGGPRYLAIVGARGGHTTLADLIDSANARAAWRFDLDWSRGLPTGVGGSVACGSDHAAYDRFGIPAVLFFTGFQPDYHQVTDEPQYSDFDKLAHVAQLVHDVAERLANADQPPPRLPPIPGLRVACQS